MLPAMGVPSEELLQDTFKSGLLALSILSIFFIYSLDLYKDPRKITIHYAVYLPVLLFLYATASMRWSHMFLAGVEAARWFLITVLVLVASNNFDIKNFSRLAWGAHIGLTIASFWTALQFWYGLSIFPQGPNPASTFVNRNFYAEYCVSAIPFSLYLLAREKRPTTAYSLTATIAFNTIALFMTGTRSALAAFGLIVLALLISYKFFKHRAIPSWTISKKWICSSIFFGIIAALGFIPTKNTNIIQEVGIQTPVERAFTRVASIAKPTEYSSGSFSVRAAMWNATLKMISVHPVLGVGAGSWEVQAPLFQKSDTLLETDFYAHNELLQLIAEYGVVGWIFVGGFVYFLLNSIKLTWHLSYDFNQHAEEIGARIVGTVGLVTLLFISNAGFPFRLAGTCALFAIYFSILLSSDIRIYSNKSKYVTQISICKFSSIATSIVSASSLILAGYIIALAVECESKIVRAIKIALTITSSKKPNDSRWDASKQEILSLINQGIAINPHYRKLTPMVADEMASWGNWEEAIEIWDSVLKSRPNVIALSTNIAKGYIQLGKFELAQEYINKSASIQPDAPAVRTVQALLFFEEGKSDRAIPLIRQLLADGFYDYQMLYVAYLLGLENHDFSLAINALELRIKHWPAEAYDAWLKLGDIYSKTEQKNDERAIFCYRMSLISSPSNYDLTLAKIPERFRTRASIAP